MVPLVVLPNTAVEVDMDTSVAEEVDTSPTELDTQDYTASRTYVPVDDKESSKNDKPSVYCHSAYVVEHANTYHQHPYLREHTRGPTRSQQGEVSHPQPPIESYINAPVGSLPQPCPIAIVIVWIVVLSR